MRDVNVPQARASAARWWKLWKQVSISRSTAAWEFSGKELFAMEALGYIATGTYLSEVVYMTEVGKTVAAPGKEKGL